MEIGKLPNEVLRALILDKIRNSRDEILIEPAVGEDCSAIDFEHELCVISSDPITGTENEIGSIAVHVSCNDIAASGAEPVGIMVTLLIPPDSSMSSVEKIMQQLANTASLLNVDIIGGHTEVTDAVNRFVISVTAIGKTNGRKLVRTAGVKPGDSFIMTKTAGLEGTAIIAFENQKELASQFGTQLVIDAKKLLSQISVIKEGLIAARHGVSAMHDITEGGLLGAVWEMCEASNCGAEIIKDCIPVLDITDKICNYYDINPLKLISSGCMLIATREGSTLVDKLQDEGIQAAIIGTATEKKSRILVTESGGIMIPSPKSDELYKVKKRQGS
ncbi:MAG: AIR synthase [Clostridiaceae bacterium]|jgi:hydrogenase maturation factor|nr:AIR synthase [Clostridiaceae bacterium]